jgi:hypothetical protein
MNDPTNPDPDDTYVCGICGRRHAKSGSRLARRQERTNDLLVAMLFIGIPLGTLIALIAMWL